MGVQIAELAGGLISFAIQLAALWILLEVGCRIFFWVRERGQGRDYCHDCGAVEWMCICGGE